MGDHITRSLGRDEGLLASQKEIEMFEMVDMIVKKNLPISVAEDPDFR